MEDLKGKFVLITGASTGIGAAAATAFAAQGANVAVHYNRSREKAEAVAEAVRAYGVKAMTVAADVADTGAIDAAVAHVLDGFGRIDVLINNAGSLVKRTPFTEVTAAFFFEDVLNVNARSVVVFARGGAGDAQARRRGHRQRDVDCGASWRRPGGTHLCSSQGVREHAHAWHGKGVDA